MGNQSQRAGALDWGGGSGDGGKVGSEVNITLEMKLTGQRQKGLLLGAALRQRARHQPLGALHRLGTQHQDRSRGPMTL